MFDKDCLFILESSGKHDQPFPDNSDVYDYFDSKISYILKQFDTTPELSFLVGGNVQYYRLQILDSDDDFEALKQRAYLEIL